VHEPQKNVSPNIDNSMITWIHLDKNSNSKARDVIDDAMQSTLFELKDFHE
jgi:hypothetical protein